jgi:hypothetical protein
LEGKDSTDYSGLETYCSQLIRQNKISWFPIKKAVVIEGRNKEKKDLPGLYRRLEILKTLEAHVEDQGDELHLVHSAQREQAGAIKELRDELATVRRSTDEIKALLEKIRDMR